MSAHHAARHPGITEVVDAARGAIALPGGVDERKVPRFAGGQEPALERVRDRLCMARADKPRAGHRPPRLHHARGRIRCDDLHVSSVLLCFVGM